MTGREEADACAKSEPNPGPSIAHDFDCTHDPCRCSEFKWPEGISGGKRANLVRSEDIDGWWVGVGKDESCQFEGPWEHMVEVARQVLAVEEQRESAQRLAQPAFDFGGSPSQEVRGG